MRHDRIMSSVVGLKPEALSRVQFSCYYGHVDSGDLVSGPNQTNKGKPVANPILLVRVFVSQVSALLRDPALQRRGLVHARKNNPMPPGFVLSSKGLLGPRVSACLDGTVFST